MNRELLTGNEAVVKGALKAGAEIMTGYPITPTTEILQTWATESSKNAKLKFLQTEDEMSAGFAMIGAVLTGKKAFTATAGPGNVLMQDAFSMAENLRLSTVAFINQRGGPSTGTVIYSQQELNLTCFGGNGEGLRIVYSASTVQEMHDLAIKAFNTAWKYRFPTFVLSDGYLAKTSTEINLDYTEQNINAEAYLLGGKDKTNNLRNCYNLETELHELVKHNKLEYDRISSIIEESETHQTKDAEIVVVAHGVVASAVKLAVDLLRKQKVKVGLFRPITLRPFPGKSAAAVLEKAKKIVVIESSLGQLSSYLKSNIYGLYTPVIEFFKPAMGFTPEEIEQFVKEQI